MSDILTIGDAVNLEVVVRAAYTNGKVARCIDGGDIVYGIARYITKDGSDDVRDSILRVTTRGGFEAFWPVRELMGEVQTGEFAIYDWS